MWWESAVHVVEAGAAAPALRSATGSPRRGAGDGATSPTRRGAAGSPRPPPRNGEARGTAAVHAGDARGGGGGGGAAEQTRDGRGGGDGGGGAAAAVAVATRDESGLDAARSPVVIDKSPKQLKTADSAWPIALAGAAALLVAGLAAGSAVLYTRRFTQAGEACLLVALAPFGALLRWQLARLNPLPKSAPPLPKSALSPRCRLHLHGVSSSRAATKRACARTCCSLSAERPWADMRERARRVTVSESFGHA